jgi:hypothetical protein
MNKEAEQIAGFDVYSHKEVKGTSFGGMKFNEGKDKKETGNLTWQAGKYYAPSTNAWYDDAAAAAAALAAIEDVYSIKGVDALGLNWTETDTKDDMIKQGDGSYLLVKSNITLAAGNYEYKAIKNHNWEWKVINSGNNLTLHVDKSGRYNITFTLNAAATEVAYALELLEEIEIIPDCYVSGNATLTGGAGWVGNEFKMTYDDVKKLHYYTFDLKKDKAYELKVVCSTWFGYDHLGAYYTEVTNKDGGIQVKLTADATVTVWFDYKTSKITFEGLTIKTFKDITFTITATSTPKIYWWNAGDKLANADWNSRPEMTPTANPNEYTYTLKDVDESTGVEYLITIGSLQTANQKTKVDVVANFKDLLTQVKVMGDFVDDWKTPFVMTIADDYETASITMALGVKTYKFKVVEGDTWLGNSGAITKTVTGWTFEDGKDNCKITTTLAGNYIFTWNFETNKLSVTYPTLIRKDLTVGNLGTVCLPYNIPSGQVYGATFYTLAGKDANGRIAFNEVTTGELAAGVPYLFQATATEVTCFPGTTIVSDPINTGAMKGTFVDLELDGSDLTDIYYFAKNALWSCVDRTELGLSVPANRAYVNMAEVTAITEPAPVGVRRITLGVNGAQVATGMEDIDASVQPVKAIINGQLFILRGEKMYDAQGKLVK